ncbi:hypothetical protein Anas_13698 [Armadillidium nasatum]|uniref:Uncharacterized protein n=1 Tax=Armadillidium nasatum TaxID=96803 RepID=A0A5N5T3T4_9CRUS|nr:hypothetical protein Anas_13698 [Armadillidium nasatum]
MPRRKMKTAVILLCFSVFLISVEGRSQPVIRVCPPIPLGIYVRDLNIVLRLQNHQNVHQMMIVLREISCAVTLLNVPTVSAQILDTSHTTETLEVQLIQIRKT